MFYQNLLYISNSIITILACSPADANSKGYFFIKLFCRIKIVYLHLRTKQNEMKQKIWTIWGESTLALYIVFAFIAWDLNPANWDVLWRFLFCLISVILLFAAHGYVSDKEREGKS